jgi:hypothetical protein
MPHQPRCEKIGECGVDSGLVMVGDPCYFIGDDARIHAKCPTWRQACYEVFDRGKPLAYDVYGLGVAVNTTYGDGVMPVYLVTDSDGRRRLVVELDGEDDATAEEMDDATHDD